MEFKQIKHAHNNFFAGSMEFKQIAIEVARISLPKKITDQIDFNSMEIAHDAWVNPQLKLHCGDIVYRAKLLKDQSKRVYILFEHKSNIDPTVQYQNLEYITDIWSEYLKQHPRSKIPTVLPVIVYHGSKPWVFDNSLKHSCEILEGAEDSLPEYKNYLLDLSLKSISTHSKSEFCGNCSIKTKAFLIALKHSRQRDVLDQVRNIIRMFSGGKKNKEYLLTLLNYIGSVIPGRMLQIFLDLIAEEHEGGAKYMRTVADSLRKEGWIKGRKEGIDIGKVKGKKEGIDIGKVKGRKEGIDIGKVKGRKEGIDIGKVKGKKEGIVIGEMKGKKEERAGIKEEQIKKEKENEKYKSQVAIKLLAKNMTVQEVARITGLSVYRVRKLKSEMP